MPIWLVLTLLAIIARALYSIATKVLSKDVEVSPITLSVLMTASAGLLAIIVSPFIGGINFSGVGTVIIPVLLVVFSQAFGNILFFKGVKNLDAGTSQIAFSSILIWSVFLSVLFLGSTFSGIQSVGVALMLGAILLIQYQGGSMKANSSVLLIIASAALFALFQVFSASISTTVSTGTYLVIAYLGSSALLSLLYFSKIKSELTTVLKQAKRSAGRVLLVGGTSLLYFLFSYLAYGVAPDRGVVVVLLTAQVILSVIFGMILLKERDNTKRKIIGAILACIAGVLIKS